MFKTKLKRNKRMTKKMRTKKKVIKLLFLKLKLLRCKSQTMFCVVRQCLPGLVGIVNLKFVIIHPKNCAETLNRRLVFLKYSFKVKSHTIKNFPLHLNQKLFKLYNQKTKHRFKPLQCLIQNPHMKKCTHTANTLTASTKSSTHFPTKHCS
jgi:hypothetical protein